MIVHGHKLFCRTPNWGCKVKSGVKLRPCPYIEEPVKLWPNMSWFLSLIRLIGSHYLKSDVQIMCKQFRAKDADADMLCLLLLIQCSCSYVLVEHS